MNQYTQRKDSATSVDQMIWGYRVAEYTRLQGYLVKYGDNPQSSLIVHAVKRIAELEKQFPALLK